MLTAAEYFRLKDQYPGDYTEEIERNGHITLDRVNSLLAIFRDAVGEELADYRISSGWRPPLYNASIANAAKRSHHMTGKAIDIRDLEGVLDDWCMDNLPILEELGLWMEAPAFTKGWCHLQIVPPRSGKRVFNP